MLVLVLGCGRATTRPAAPPLPPPDEAVTWPVLEAIADGKHPALRVRPELGVFVLTEDSCKGSSCTAKIICGAAAVEEVRSTVRTMVQRNRQGFDPDLPGECGALGPELGASTTCTMPGVAEYDAAYELYLVRTREGVAAAGITITEVGHRDVGVFDQAGREIAPAAARCR